MKGNVVVQGQTCRGACEDDIPIADWEEAFDVFDGGGRAHSHVPPTSPLLHLAW